MAGGYPLAHVMMMLPPPDLDAAQRIPHASGAHVQRRGHRVNWPLAFSHLVAESAGIGLRELHRLEAVAEKGRGIVADSDKRALLPDGLDALLRVPVLTQKGLATQLRRHRVVARYREGGS